MLLGLRVKQEVLITVLKKPKGPKIKTNVYSFEKCLILNNIDVLGIIDATLYHINLRQQIKFYFIVFIKDSLVFSINNNWPPIPFKTASVESIIPKDVEIIK